MLIPGTEVWATGQYPALHVEVTGTISHDISLGGVHYGGDGPVYRDRIVGGIRPSDISGCGWTGGACKDRVDYISMPSYTNQLEVVSCLHQKTITIIHLSTAHLVFL